MNGLITLPPFPVVSAGVQRIAGEIVAAAGQYAPAIVPLLVQFMGETLKATPPDDRADAILVQLRLMHAEQSLAATRQHAERMQSARDQLEAPVESTCGLTSQIDSPHSAEIAGQQASETTPNGGSAPWARVKRGWRALVEAVIRRPGPRAPRSPELAGKVGRPRGHCRLGRTHRAMLIAIAGEQVKLQAAAVHPGTHRLSELVDCSERYVPVILADLVAIKLLDLVELGGGWVTEKGCGRAHMLALSDRAWDWLSGNDGVQLDEIWELPANARRNAVPPLNKIQGGLSVFDTLDVEKLSDVVDAVSRPFNVVVAPEPRRTERDPPPFWAKPAVRTRIARLAPNAVVATKKRQNEAPWAKWMRPQSTNATPPVVDHAPAAPPAAAAAADQVRKAEERLRALVDGKQGMDAIWAVLGVTT